MLLILQELIAANCSLLCCSAVAVDRKHLHARWMLVMMQTTQSEVVNGCRWDGGLSE
jgi:hypothetical protein